MKSLTNNGDKDVQAFLFPKERKDFCTSFLCSHSSLFICSHLYRHMHNLSEIDNEILITTQKRVWVNWSDLHDNKHHGYRR